MGFLRVGKKPKCLYCDRKVDYSFSNNGSEHVYLCDCGKTLYYYKSKEGIVHLYKPEAKDNECVKMSIQRAKEYGRNKSS